MPNTWFIWAKYVIHLGLSETNISKRNGNIEWIKQYTDDTLLTEHNPFDYNNDDTRQIPIRMK